MIRRFRDWWAYWFGPQEVTLSPGTIITGTVTIRGRVRIIGLTDFQPYECIFEDCHFLQNKVK